MEQIRLTQYSHGAGCGCKISPKILDAILHTDKPAPLFPGLLVGNDTRDDAAVLDIGNGQLLISTTDFFMPVVDDPYDFGRIAATNAISDVYAMGGKPVLAIAILGWPIDKLAPEIAAKVVEGGRAVCEAAGIPLAGGHSIDAPEPIFGLAVNGLVSATNLKKNSTAQKGDLLFLTKPLGVGIYTTAQKKGLLSDDHLKLAVHWMTTLNKAGERFGTLQGVTALTDVTGFGLLGHLREMADGSGLSAEVDISAVPVLPGLSDYLEQKCFPGGTNRNWASYGSFVSLADEQTRYVLGDPQTSGGLLAAVRPEAVEDFQAVVRELGLVEWAGKPIGRLIERGEFSVVVR
jgi:selenide,water dikinase